MICGLDTLMLVYWVGRVVSISKNIMKIECVRMLQMLQLVALSSRVVCIESHARPWCFFRSSFPISIPSLHTRCLRFVSVSRLHSLHFFSYNQQYTIPYIKPHKGCTAAEDPPQSRYRCHCWPPQSPLCPSTSQRPRSSPSSSSSSLCPFLLHSSPAHPSSKTSSVHSPTYQIQKEIEEHTFPLTTTSSCPPKHPTSTPSFQTPFRNTIPRKSVFTITQSFTSHSFNFVLRRRLPETWLFSIDPLYTAPLLTTLSLALQRDNALPSATVLFDTDARRREETLSSVLFETSVRCADGMFVSVLWAILHRRREASLNVDVVILHRLRWMPMLGDVVDKLELDLDLDPDPDVDRELGPGSATASWTFSVVLLLFLAIVADFI